MGKDTEVTVGYKYYLGIHMVFCWGPIDRVEQIVVGDRIARDDDITGSGPITINKPELFGGDEREGGVEGVMDVSFGDVDTPNSYLTNNLGSQVPAYLNVVSFVLRKMHLTSLNPYIKQWIIKAKRTLVNTDGTPRWYSSAADISGQCNPAHIVYEVLTNSQWGMGYPTNAIDDSNFRSAADTFKAEGFGLWIKWSSSAKIKEVIREVESTVDCHLYQDASTGLFKLKLIRDDYDPGTVPTFDETNIISVDKFEHRGWGETINEVTVEYTDPNDRGKTAPVTVQDLGNIQMQGHVIGIKKAYPALTTGALAARVAARDLRVLSVPLAVVELMVNREAWDMIVGDVFKLSWEKYGVSAVYFRVAKISKGTLTDGSIKINAIEDVFLLPSAVYVEPQDPQWHIPNNPPAPVVEQMAMYVGYWDIHQTLPQANIEYLDPNYAGAIINATVATTDTFNYKIYAVDQAGTTGIGSPAAFGRLQTEIDNKINVIEIHQGTLLAMVVAGEKKYLVIDDELMRIESIVFQAGGELFGEITVGRGALDTVPVAHAVDAAVWFPAQFGSYETSLERVDGEAVTYRLLPRTTLGSLEYDDPSITDLNITLYDRYQRPYPPGYLSINGEYLPSSVDSNTITITWQDRNRVLETANIICKDDDSSGGADADVEYWIELLDTAGGTITGYPKNMGTALIETYDNLPTLYPQMTVRLWANYITAGLPSWQTFEHTFLTEGGHQHSQLEHTSISGPNPGNNPEHL